MSWALYDGAVAVVVNITLMALALAVFFGARVIKK